MGNLASLALAGDNEKKLCARQIQEITQGQKAEVVFTTDSIYGYYSQRALMELAEDEDNQVLVINTQVLSKHSLQTKLVK